MPTSISEAFSSFLSARLSTGVSLRVYHASTAPTSCPPLYAAAPGQSEEQTRCESHFLAISQPQEPTTSTATINHHDTHTIVLGIEVLVFTSSTLTTIFVSKADSTGFLLRRQNSPRGTSIAQLVIAAFLEFLVSARLNGPRLVLSLFARSQNQYLFPGSIENASKHVLDDRQLIKWWCRVLDPLVHPRSIEQLVTPGATQAYVVVPGCDRSETRVFFPASTRLEASTQARWVARYPVELLVKDGSLPPRCLVPRLPDDPKARFLDDLDGNQVNSEGRWSGVKSLDQFWELMSYRQECSAGRLVGFVWIVFPYKPLDQKAETGCTQPDLSKDQPASIPFQQSNKGETLEACNVRSETVHEEAISTAAESIHEGLHSKSSPLLSQALEMHNDKSVQDVMVAVANNNPSSPQADQASKGQISLTQSDYSVLLDHLLDLDFAGIGTACQSTNDWIEKAKFLAKQTNFGLDVEGQMIVEVTDSMSIKDAVAPQTTNILTAVRKKRKADPVDPPIPTLPVDGPVVNALNAGLVRKKPKS